MGSTSNNQCNSGGIRISGEEPHFISLGNGRLSTGVTIFEIPTGLATIPLQESIFAHSIFRKHHDRLISIL